MILGVVEALQLIEKKKEKKKLIFNIRSLSFFKRAPRLQGRWIELFSFMRGKWCGKATRMNS